MNNPHYARIQREAGKLTVLNTNGELLRRRFGSDDDLPFDVVGVSVEGPSPEVQGLMRGQGANFDETVRAAAWVSSSLRARLKIATVLSRVNLRYVDALAGIVRRLDPAVWRIYQYSPRGPQNSGRIRHEISEQVFTETVERIAVDVAPVPVRSSTVRTTIGCLIVDPFGNVLSPAGDDYITLGNCLDESLEKIWSRAPNQCTVIENKRWLTRLDAPMRKAENARD